VFDTPAREIPILEDLNNFELEEERFAGLFVNSYSSSSGGSSDKEHCTGIHSLNLKMLLSM